MPIGMTKQVGDDVTVTGGVYPDKTPVKITRFDNIQLNKQAAILTLNEKGETRRIDDLILIVNPFEYFSKILPAIQVPLPGGGYAQSLPFDMTIIQSPAVKWEQRSLVCQDYIFAEPAWNPTEESFTQTITIFWKMKEYISSKVTPTDLRLITMPLLFLILAIFSRCITRLKQL